jgi:hypothetical protein
VINWPTVRVLTRVVSDDWRGFSLDSLQYGHRVEAQLLVFAVVGLSLVLLVARLAIRRRAGIDFVVVPGLQRTIRSTGIAWVMQVPLVLFLVGLLFLALAVADPYTALVSREVSYPGRRIALAIDASGSMATPFTAGSLNTRATTDAAFFTTVAAAERFVQMRRKASFHDLISLIEFGDEAYVITPFTTDYDNVLLSMSLIGDPTEFDRFPDSSTLIARAIDVSVDLFKAFKFLDAAGNLLVIFSDGEDSNAAVRGRSLDDIVQGALDAKVPVYFVRMNYDKTSGQNIPDDLWMPAIRKTGGEFFAASDEKSLLEAINEIDKVAAGRVEMKEYNSQLPRFAVFGSIAALCFASAIGSKLAVPYFRRFP